MPKVPRGWLVALSALALWLIATLGLRGTAGLVRSVVTNTPDHTVIDSRPATAIYLGDVDGAAGGPAGLTAVWRGTWEIRQTDFYTLQVESRGRAVWTVDQTPGVETASADGRASRTIWLTKGFHEIELRYAVDRSAPHFVATAAKAGQTQAPLDPAALKPRAPRNPWLRTVAQWLTSALGWIAIVALILAIRRTAPPIRDGWSPRSARAVAGAALACVLIFGGLLRLDALTIRYGVVTSPSWIAALQTRTWLSPDLIRTDWMVWSPEPLYPHADGVSTHYRSDPYIYLDIGRTMTAFYEPQFREPVFPFATRVFLYAFNNQDVAVSFASLTFSLVAIWLTYLLGAALWSRPVGLLAALGLAIDYDVISLATLGWRDDAYAAMVVLCAYLMVRCWRAGQATGEVRRLGWIRVDAAYWEAVQLGAAGGFAILTRIMAVPFLVAGAIVVLVALRAPIRRRATMVGLATLVATIIGGPYFFNCWRVHGDPLYTFNVHGGIYSVSEGLGEWKGTTASYVVHKFATRPIEMIDSVAQGLTTYPFGNKWHGLNPWGSRIGDRVAIAALAGLVLLAAIAEGRLVIVSMLGSLLPFAFTWKVDPHFRFTEHAYPVLLIAAAIAIVFTLRLIRAALVAGSSHAPWQRWTSWRAWAAMVGITLAVLWSVSRWLQPWVVAEALGAREDVNVTAGVLDAAFFGSGWSPVLHSGNVNLRVTSHEGALDVRLPAVDDYPATLRMDPFPEPVTETPVGLPKIEILLNGVTITSVPLQWTPARVGSYDFVLPRTNVHQGANRIIVRVKTSGLTDGDAVGLWYLRIHPPAGAR